MISAEVICDSISPAGKRLITFKLRYPRFIHAEFMTHRVISRNASSSRAVPTAKLIEEVRSDALRATPEKWGKNQKGMQAFEELEHYPTKFGEVIDISPRGKAIHLWNEAAWGAAGVAQRMEDLGVHKQIVNRILEPFTHINVVATATEWDNFFGLRLDAGAEPTMQALAVAMWSARKTSTPALLSPGEWHLPFFNWDETRHPNGTTFWDMSTGDAETVAIKVSVARCARVSYQSFETGKRSTVEEDLALYEKLLGAQPLHASPGEHQATPIGPGAGSHESGQCGNFVGWRQYRKMLSNESCAPLPEAYR